MSFQRHFKRNESWLVSSGKCEVIYSKSDPSKTETVTLRQGDRFYVPVKEWHQITNPFSEECRIIEIQYGEETNDEDIERLYYYQD
jgi:mannose-6-phosphate isomerase-like protein (cupin superfamily)